MSMSCSGSASPDRGPRMTSCPSRSWKITLMDFLHFQRFNMQKGRVRDGDFFPRPEWFPPPTHSTVDHVFQEGRCRRIRGPSLCLTLFPIPPYAYAGFVSCRYHHVFVPMTILLAGGWAYLRTSVASVMPLRPFMYCRRPVAMPLPRSRPAIVEATPEYRPVENLHSRCTATS